MAKKEEEKSYALHFLLLSGLLIGFSLWALWEEVAALRPWKAYQRTYYQLERSGLERELKAAKAAFERPEIQEEYRRIQSLLKDAQDAFNRPETQQAYRRTEDQLDQVEEELSKLQRALQDAQGRAREREYRYHKYDREEDRSKL